MNKVEAIVTSLDDEILKYGFEGLSYMKNLRLLKILGFVPRFKPELKYLPNSLQYLELYDCCDNEFPSSFQARKLGHLKLWYSNIERLWNNRIKVSLFMPIPLGTHKHCLEDLICSLF